ncbi:electron transporter RnfC [Anoxybacter fermentans]|uniref:Ion-translocating oxidoreductase complex subunit C n=1 Tax=Anoxybacter fermentans TaxID=1323375 RepID=A0A3Q9HQW0_9FIRM|nr:electron transport complex subunit RsxC [Anoxybacter fermentans]AZR73300.1 electron transporter RnfC [Anoxybacter fermentans]
MKVKTFKQGIHPAYNKELTAGKALQKAKDPAQVVIPLQQNIGAPCEPLVKVGDQVKVGQKIGESQSFVSAPIHSSISGVVKAIREVEVGTGRKTLAVIIESDGQNTLHEDVKPKGDLDSLSGDEIREIIREAGIVGMGGAMFPTHVKLSVPEGKTVDTVILNGAECEPYLTVDHRIMIEHPEEVVYGLKALMKVLNVNKGYIGIEDNKSDAIEAMIKATENEPEIEVVPLETKYPQGGEKMLITAVTGREVPSGGLPADAGCVVNNVTTAYAIAKAIKTGMPLIERPVTITGRGIKEPKNLMVKIGTSVAELIEQAGGFKGKPGKVILGGPMMGISAHNIDVPVLKGTSGILVLTADEVEDFEPRPCIRCARCVDVCPVFLMPVTLANYAQHDMFAELENYNVLDCIECGSCSYICPAKRPLLHYIRLGKAEVLAQRRKK